VRAEEEREEEEDWKRDTEEDMGAGLDKGRGVYPGTTHASLLAFPEYHQPSLHPVSNCYTDPIIIVGHFQPPQADAGAYKRESKEAEQTGRSQPA
jgi:hypothetical protein